MSTSRFHIPGMDCATEQEVIRRRLQREPAVTSLAFDLIDRIVTVHHDLGAEQTVESALTDIDMQPRRLDQPSGGQTKLGVPIRVADDTRREAWLLGVAGIAALGSEVAAVALGDETHVVVIGLAGLAMSFGGLKPFKKGLVALKTLTLNINLLMVVAVIGAFAIGQWPEAAMVTVLFAIAELIESRSIDRARDAIRSLMALTPETARLKRGEVWTEVAVTEVAPGESIQILPGERVPLDGTITSGQTAIDQAPITGESIPVDKAPGDPVFAGTINGHGVVVVTVTAGQGDTTVARIARTIRDAQAQKAPNERFVDRFAKIYTPAIFALALVIAVLPPLVFGGSWHDWIYKALVLLVIACPCALVISTPITIVSALAAAARRGILVKGGVHLEGARHLKFLAVDKTGTLTHGKPVLTDVVALGDASPDFVLTLAASLEATSTHPLAQAVVQGLADRSPGTSLIPVVRAENLVGRGLQGDIDVSFARSGPLRGGPAEGRAAVGDSRTVVVGSHRLAEERGVCGPHIEAVLGRLEGEGKSVMIVWVDGIVIGVLGVADTVRDTSIEAIRILHGQGIKVAMLTGDNPTTARAVADQIGIDEVAADLLPEDKLRAVERLVAEHGAVGMVGDGVNDAPALARATIGFAMGVAGTDTALETADVALMRDDLRKIPELVALSRRTRKTLLVNISIALGLKAVFFLLGLFGIATLWMAVFADMGASLIVAINGLSLLRAPRSDSSHASS